jgi:single-strand DNA-binding protein
MNNCIIVGRLVRDPEMRVAQSSGKSIASFTVAVDRTYGDQTDFLPVIVWDKQGEACGKYLRKGSLVAVAGSVQTRSYEAQDKSKRWVTEIIADEVQFLSRNEGAKPPAQEQAREPGEEPDGDDLF